MQIAVIKPSALRSGNAVNSVINNQRVLSILLIKQYGEYKLGSIRKL